MLHRKIALGIATTCALATTLGSTPASAAAPHHSPKTVPPVQTSQLVPALHKYRAYVHRHINALVPEVERLHTQLARHEVAKAKKTWLQAHLVWLRIGQDDGAYGVFGDLGRSIDGTTAGYQRGVRDPKFTGFHRIEYDLWHRADLAAATKASTTLVADIRRLAHVSLSKAIPATIDGANTFTLRSHEIIEDALRDTLSGDDEYGSGTALASVTADVGATREVITLLAPLIKPRSPGRVTKCRHDLSRLVVVAKTGRHHGHWAAIRSLNRRQRQAIDAAIGAADEELAPIPDLLQIGV